MAWNQPDDDQGRKPRGGGLRAAGGNSPWHRWRQRWGASPQARGPLIAVAAGVALLLWLGSGFYQLDDGERGVLQRFGAYQGLREGGAGWHLPWPIETITAISLGKPNNADFQARMYTAEAMLVNVTASFEYQYVDARAGLFALRDPDGIVRELGEAATRELVARQRIEDLMGGAARPALALALRAAVQQPLDAMGSGLRVLAVHISDVQVPEAVLPAQRDLVQAGVERDRLIREAQAHAAEILPAARGLAQQQRLEAETYKVQTVGAAEGEAARFAPLAAAYARAPEVTRNRLYIETIESILAHSRKVIIDGKGGNTLVLPLERLSDAGALKALGVTGIVTSAGAAPAAQGPAAAATPAATSATPAAGVVRDGIERDDRSRDRGRDRGEH